MYGNNNMMMNNNMNMMNNNFGSSFTKPVRHIDTSSSLNSDHCPDSNDNLNISM